MQGFAETLLISVSTPVSRCQKRLSFLPEAAKMQRAQVRAKVFVRKKRPAGPAGRIGRQIGEH
jgi:hypothetical protein